jgi:hypothetical protein
MDFELRAFIEDRRAELKQRRRTAAKRTNARGADCAIRELDRLEGWLNLSRQRALAEHPLCETGGHARVQAVRELKR